MNTKAQPLDSIVENPALVETLDHEACIEVLGRLLQAAGPVLARFVTQECQARDSKPTADRLLTLKEVSERLKRSPKSISQGWRAGRYQFMLKDGAHLVGSEDGLNRWIKVRTHATRYNQQ